MRRKRRESPISLFSFQDVIMSVVGIVILITLLLILKLITQPPSSSPNHSAATVSARQLQQKIESLNSALQEIQKEITQQHQTKLESVVTPQIKNQIDAVIATTKRIDTECNKLNNEIQNEKKRTENLKNDLKIKSTFDSKKQIKQMKEQLDKLKIEKDELSKQEKQLQTTADELTLKNQQLDDEITAAVPPQLLVSIQKKADKKAFLCVYGQDGLEIIPTDGSIAKKFTSQSAFYNWLDSCNKSTDHFIIYFRPSRFGRYKEIVDRIKSKGFDIGYQVIGEKTNLINNTM